MAADESFVWLRPATKLENLMDCATKKGFYVTVYGLTVRSSVPLSDSHIKETLHHIFSRLISDRVHLHEYMGFLTVSGNTLVHSNTTVLVILLIILAATCNTVLSFRLRSEGVFLAIKHGHRHEKKVPVLRMCFRKRGDTLWACDMNREQLDYQVTETQELVPAVEALFHHHFSTTEGPLWCARLLPAGAPGRCSRPEVAIAFPHSRTLLLANHHGIADGTTNMFITDAFLRVLDEVVAGKPIDDTAQLGRLVAGEETKAILEARMEELMKDEGRFQQIQDDMEKSKQKKKLIPLAYPMSRDPDYKSQIILRDLDKETTQSFIRKCKNEGVTVNSGLVAVFNVSLVDFVREGGLEQDFYQVQEQYSVNMRSYWPGDTSGTLGVHRLAMENVASTPAMWRDSFWDYSRSIHKNISQSLQEKDIVLDEVLMMNGGNAENYFVERPMPACDHSTSNMGNSDHLIPTEGQHVRLVHLLRVTSCLSDPMYHMFHTLRGCFMYSLAYPNDILTRRNAQKLVDKIFENLKAVTLM